jgi:hypothetical protein
MNRGRGGDGDKRFMKEERKYREAVEDECEMEDDYAQDECY